MTQSYSGAIPAQNGNNGKRAPGRPRSEESRQAILGSTLKLLRQQGGFHDLRIEAVASDAKVSKATVYRWWPTKAALVVDAFSASADEELRFQDTGSLHRDISQQMHRVIRIFRSPRGKVLSALLAGGQSDPELLEAFRDRFLWPRRREAYQTLQRGIDRGELSPGVDLDLLLDSLYGPIYMRFLIRHTELSESFADQLCRLILNSAQGSRA